MDNFWVHGVAKSCTTIAKTVTVSIPDLHWEFGGLLLSRPQLSTILILSVWSSGFLLHGSKADKKGSRFCEQNTDSNSMYRCARCVSIHTELNCTSLFPKRFSSTSHVSFFAALYIDDKHTFFRIYFIYFPTNSPLHQFLRRTISTAEWRINTNPMFDRFGAGVAQPVRRLSQDSKKNGTQMTRFKERRWNWWVGRAAVQMDFDGGMTLREGRSVSEGWHSGFVCGSLSVVWSFLAEHKGVVQITACNGLKWVQGKQRKRWNMAPLDGQVSVGRVRTLIWCWRCAGYASENWGKRLRDVCKFRDAESVYQVRKLEQGYRFGKEKRQSLCKGHGRRFSGVNIRVSLICMLKARWWLSVVFGTMEQKLVDIQSGGLDFWRHWLKRTCFEWPKLVRLGRWIRGSEDKKREKNM